MSEYYNLNRTRNLYNSESSELFKISNKKRFITESAVSFLLGINLVVLLLLVSVVFPDIKKYAYPSLYFSMVEELVKYTLAIFLVFQLRFLLFTIPFIGIGFGFAEALSRLYYYKLQASLIAFNFHIVLGLTMTALFYYGYKSKNFRNIYYALALLIPLYLHVFYNLLVFLK